MKKGVVMILGLFILSITGVATAGSKTGPYIGGSLGYANIEVSESFYKFDDDDLGFKIFSGFNFGVVPLVDLAVEGSYVDFGRASYLKAKVDVTGWDVFGLAALNLGPVAVFGKAGHIWWRRDSAIDALDNNGNDMAYGGGVRFQIKSFSIRGEYEYFDLNYTKVGMFSAGVAWTF